MVIHLQSKQCQNLGDYQLEGIIRKLNKQLFIDNLLNGCLVIVERFICLRRQLELRNIYRVSTRVKVGGNT